jgi:hypothetical protein
VDIATRIPGLQEPDRHRSADLYTEAFPAKNNVIRYWARPHCPKDKPRVERFVGTFLRECPDDYRHYRPHEAPGCMTPAEFSAKTGISIPRVGKLS